MSNGNKNRLQLGAILHFILVIGHLGCLFALDKASPLSLNIK